MRIDVAVAGLALFLVACKGPAPETTGAAPSSPVSGARGVGVETATKSSSAAPGGKQEATEKSVPAEEPAVAAKAPVAESSAAKKPVATEPAPVAESLAAKQSAAAKKAVAAKQPAARALEIARRCAAAAPFDGRGVGGNALVYDDMTWSQPPAATRTSDYIFFVYIPEEPPRTQIPNGLALGVDTLRERCSRAPMD